ncbi:YdeI family protein [Dactylosporangium sp. NPDC051541]|uniref:YdeI family protein n=1 Tax=Dactylosporangium sp. NPDC051541 TaxID=3363977 RepID=UPI003795578F
MPGAELEELIVADAGALRAWLADNHTTSAGVWLALTRKGGAVTTLTWQQAVDEGLCFGWIDGQARKGNAEHSWIRFTPRTARSPWSQRNVAHVERLEADGLMRDAGRAVVEAAKADGRWAAAYAPPSEAEVPEDLAAAIAAEPAAQAMFDVLTKTNRFAIIYRVNAVKRAETRVRKIGEVVAMLARHEAFHPQKARPVPPAG